MNSMQLAKAYNAATGANITHRDVTEWGIKEESGIIAAMEIMGILS